MIGRRFKRSTTPDIRIAKRLLTLAFGLLRGTALSSEATSERALAECRSASCYPARKEAADTSRADYLGLSCWSNVVKFAA